MQIYMLDWLILSPDCQAFGEQLEKKYSDSIRLGLWLNDNLDLTGLKAELISPQNTKC